MKTYKENIQNLKDKIFEFYKSTGENEQLNNLITDSNLDNETIHALLRFHSTYTSELNSIKQFNHRSFNLILDEFYKIEIERLLSVNELEKDIIELKNNGLAKWAKWLGSIMVIVFLIILIFALHSINPDATKFAVDSVPKISNPIKNDTNPASKGEQK